MFAFQVENSDYVVFGNLQRVGTSLDQDYNFYVFFFFQGLQNNKRCTLSKLSLLRGVCMQTSFIRMIFPVLDFKR